MAHHIFLTGDKQVGKSTLLQKALLGYTKTIGGFYTVRTNQLLQDSYSVHLYLPKEPPLACQENLLFVCGECTDSIPQRFNVLGCQALERAQNSSLILMDELGRHEANAYKFRQAVLSQLEKDIPIVGVLQHPAEIYWPEIVSHPKVQVLTIAKENREDPDLMKQIRSVIFL